MARLNPCVDCVGPAEGCESPCLKINQRFELYLVASYAKSIASVELLSVPEWRGLCRELSTLSRYLTHYATTLIQLDQLAKAKPPVTAEWPSWVVDRAEVYMARHRRAQRQKETS